jgi:hypothetical protein
VHRLFRIGILALAGCSGLGHLLGMTGSTTAPLIGTAISAVRTDSHPARATETVRYDDRSLVLLASYPVNDGRVADPATADRHKELWALTRATLPDNAVQQIRQLNIVTDGRYGTLAMVHRSSLDTTTWVLSMDPAEDDEVIVSTLIHEYAHMLSLRSADLRSASASRNGCDGVRIEIGCARAGSVLAEWHDTFWAGASEPARAGSGFVTPYAAMSVHEDLAESFLAWVRDDVDRPTPGIEARFAFLRDRPELVEARAAILERIAAR